MEDANWFSKLLFYWVNPMMEKGLQGKISNSDDLYDLPMSLNCGLISAKLSKHLNQGKGDRSDLTGIYFVLAWL